MMHITICKKNEKNTKRFRRDRKRLFIIPLSEEQILRSAEEFRMEA